ncbi:MULTISPECIES: hypothetical protein [unclassified Scytonema]|uniref:hypothetical protein n=1 Tax=unclassified Scytonema TaxID=2618749 RepID=UPI00130159C4|nr:hypothetical protein [Scytonema sp. HK-05]
MPTFSVVCPDDKLRSNTPGTDDITFEQSATFVDSGSTIEADTEQSAIASLYYLHKY